MDKDGTKWMIILDLLAWECVIYIHDYIYEAEELPRVHTGPDVEWCNIPYLNMHQGMYAKATILRIFSMICSESPNIYLSYIYETMGLVWAWKSNCFLPFGMVGSSWVLDGREPLLGSQMTAYIST